jgi:hypothetical protein
VEVSWQLFEPGYTLLNVASVIANRLKGATDVNPDFRVSLRFYLEGQFHQGGLKG